MQKSELYGLHYYADICPRTKRWTQADLTYWQQFYFRNPHSWC